MFLTLLSIVFLTSTIVYLTVQFYYNRFKRHGIPGPEPSFPFGNAKGSILKKRNIVYEIDDVYQGFKDKSPIASFYTLFSSYLVATDPELIKQMFIKDFNKFRNNDFVVSHTNDPIIARNPFWMKDEAWKEKRNEVIPAMTPAKLKAVYPLIVAGTKSLTEYIKREITKDILTAFNSRDISAKYTCDTITSCTFGAEAGSFTSDNPFFYEKGKQMIRGMATAFQSPYATKVLPGEIEKFFVQIAKEAIRCRSESDTKQDDFLTYTIALKEKKNLDDLEAASHCVTLFLDGYETTSVTLHHAFHEIACNKKAQAKLRKEINDALADEDFFSYEKLLELPYLNQVFYETMRLHPPLLYTTRVASEDVEIKGFMDQKILIRKDQAIWIPIPSIQRDPQYFPNPEAFNPERFDVEHGGIKSFKDRGVLIPFGDGPRICSGMRFAYIQVKAAIAAVVKDFEISVDKQTPERETLRISPTEFMNVYSHKLMLNFKSIKI